jgi:hypothetical protein
MKRILSAFVLFAALAVSAQAGPFSFENLSRPKSVRIPADILAQVADVPETKPVKDDAPKQVADVLNRKTNPVLAPQPNARQALNATQGACANGQCGRN